MAGSKPRVPSGPSALDLPAPMCNGEGPQAPAPLGEKGDLSDALRRWGPYSRQQAAAWFGAILDQGYHLYMVSHEGGSRLSIPYWCLLFRRGGPPPTTPGDAVLQQAELALAEGEEDGIPF